MNATTILALIGLLTILNYTHDTGKQVVLWAFNRSPGRLQNRYLPAMGAAYITFFGCLLYLAPLWRKLIGLG